LPISGLLVLGYLKYEATISVYAPFRLLLM
jgi:hypothetical protein